MGRIVEQVGGGEVPEAVMCPVCGRENRHMEYCRHVRWTFDQGGPIEFAQYACEASPYIEARGHRAAEIQKFWWEENAEWVADKVIWHFDARDGYVFGELVDLDLLAREIWKRYMPEPQRASLARIDPY